MLLYGCYKCVRIEATQHCLGDTAIKLYALAYGIALLSLRRLKTRGRFSEKLARLKIQGTIPRSWKGP